MIKHGFLIGLSLALSSIAGCATDGNDGSNGANGENGTDGTDGTDGTNGTNGTNAPVRASAGVYTFGNAVTGNQVTAYTRATTGALSRQGGYATTGAGTGAGLGSQGALVFDDATQRFFAVNAGDDTLSMLALDAGGALHTLAKIATGGKRPVSVAVRDGLVYVVHQGDLSAATVGANLTGFAIKGDALVAIAGSTRALSATTDVRPTDIAFSPDGTQLVVAERFAHKLDTFALTNGVAQPGKFQTSAGMQPFAFDWSPEGALIVAEVGTGGATSSSASSYTLATDGTLTAVTSALPTLQGAACWIVVAGGHAFVANAASANITGLDIAPSGALTLHDSNGITATTGAGAIDLAVSPDHGYLYSLAGGPHEIRVFEIGSDGSLDARPSLTNIPAAAAGLVAR